MVSRVTEPDPSSSPSATSRPTPTGLVSDQGTPVRPTLRPVPRWAIAVGIPVMVLVAAGVVWLLLGIGAGRDQLDAIRTGSALAVGLGGIIVLWLAIRRQRSTELDLLQKYETHQLAERVAEAAERDATARRITDLYTKAVDQLGSDKAPVRLGGLYALERLAQDNTDPLLRQTVVNMVCAYLRMPIPTPTGASQPPTAASIPSPTGTRGATHRRTHPRKSPQDRARPRALHLLAQHRPRPHWRHPDVSRLLRCQAQTVHFNHATFVGLARFDHAEFTGDVWFDDAEFTGDAHFDHARFTGNASFNGAEFTGDARFGSAEFLMILDLAAMVRADADLADHRVWPAGWLQTDDPAPSEGRPGTWVSLVPVDAPAAQEDAR